jgi:hypothetical protein
MWLCGAAASDDPITFGCAGRRFDGGGLDKLAFRRPPRDLFIDFARQSNDVLLGPAIVVQMILIRALPGSI